MKTNTSLSYEQNRLNAQHIASLSDKEVRAYARAKTAHDERNKTSNLISGAVFSLFPTVDSFAHGIQKGGTLGQKVTSGVGRSIGWTAALGACYFAIKSANDLLKNNPKFGQFAQNHPVLTEVAALTGVYAIANGAFALTNKVKEKFVSKEGIKEVQQAVEKLPYASKINEKVLDKLKPVIQNRIVRNAVGVGFVALIVKKLVDISTFNAKVDNNYKHIKQAQAYIADELEV